MENRMDTFVSTVFDLNTMDVVYLEDYLVSLHDHLKRHYNDYEIIILSRNVDGSIQKDILEKISSIRWIEMAIPIDGDMLLNVGIEHAIGDYVVFLRTGIDPVHIIHEMVEKCSEGHNLVIGVADYPKTWSYKMARKVGQGWLRVIDYSLPKNATPVRCLSRGAINIILSTGQNRRQLFSKISISGCSMTEYPYKLLESSLLKKKTLFLGMRDLLRIMVFNSGNSLRWINILGILGSFCSFLFALYSILINFIKDDVIEGWTTVVFSCSFLFMILFVILAFLGEYMERLLREIFNQQNFYVSSEKKSSFMIEMDRFNVFE